MDNANRLIWQKFNIKQGDTLPFRGWHTKTSRELLAQVFAELGFKSGAEIGVSYGLYSELLCRTISGLQLTCVDPYAAYERVTQEVCDERREAARQRLAPFGVTFKIMPSMDAVREVADESLDFVYIDGAHDFDNCMMDLIQWSRKVRGGGIVSGHDYYKFYRAGVVPAVNAYAVAHNIGTWYITHDREASFLWVKQ